MFEEAIIFTRTLGDSGYYMYHLLNVLKLCISPTEYAHKLHMILKINNSCFAKQHINRPFFLMEIHLRTLTAGTEFLNILR
jgi:hypothetical protein